MSTEEKRRSAGLYPYRSRFPVMERLPDTARPREELFAELAVMAAEEDALAQTGRVSGSIYHGDHDHYEFLTKVFGLYCHANVLQRDMYPSATKMEAEIISMTADMLHGSAAPGVCGVITSGGTESLTQAMLVYGERGRIEKGITDPEVILPVTAHVALNKACHYFGIRVLAAPVDANWVVDVDWVAEHITENTVALVGSAGTYPHGLVDPIAALGDLALERDIGLHVDGCLGGFLLPWGERLGLDIPTFDFRVPGVTSISADTHKYGYALKGTSVLLYRAPELRRFQYFTSVEWPGGLYFSPGMAGSRSGGMIASTWAAMVSIGSDGYQRIAADIFRTAATITEGVRAIPELFLFGTPTFVVGVGSDVLDIYHVSDALSQKGWRMNNLQRPPGFHFCITRPNTAPGIAEAYVSDLHDAVEYAKHPPEPKAKAGAMYGMGGTPEGQHQMREAMTNLLDRMHALPEGR